MTAALTPNRTALHTVPRDNPGYEVEYGKFLDCIHCGLCLAACPTYEELGTETDGPRGRIYLMRAVTDGRLAVDHAVQEHLDLCLNCRACETACPSGVQYHRLLEPFREGLAAQGPPARQLPWIQRQVLEHLFPYRWRSRLALAPVRLLQKTGIESLLQKMGFYSLLPKSLRSLHEMLPALQPHYGRLPEVLPAIGKRRARVALFLGCVADAVYPETNLATAKVLQANGCEVWIPSSQGCCGALDHHSHHETRARAFGSINLETFGFGRGDVPEPDAIIVNAAGCGAMLKEYPDLFRGTEQSDSAGKFAAKVRDIHEFLMELGPVPPKHRLKMKATYHDACHLRHAQHVYTQPRQLLGMIPGLELVPLYETELCCGAAGSYNLTEPEMSARLGERKAKHILATGADAVFTGNVGCLLQVAKHLRAARPDFWVAHPIDALWASYSGETRR